MAWDEDFDEDDVMDEDQYGDVFTGLVDDLGVDEDVAADYIDSMRMEGLTAFDVSHLIDEGEYHSIEGDGGGW